MSENLGRPPETTCGYTQKVARKDHRCCACEAKIERGVLYVQDDYYAPFGNGRRYCLKCAQENEQAETEWQLKWEARAALAALDNE